MAKHSAMVREMLATRRKSLMRQEEILLEIVSRYTKELADKDANKGLEPVRKLMLSLAKRDLKEIDVQRAKIARLAMDAYREAVELGIQDVDLEKHKWVEDIDDETFWQTIDAYIDSKGKESA